MSSHVEPASAWHGPIYAISYRGLVHTGLMGLFNFNFVSKIIKMRFFLVNWTFKISGPFLFQFFLERRVRLGPAHCMACYGAATGPWHAMSVLPPLSLKHVAYGAYTLYLCLKFVIWWDRRRHWQQHNSQFWYNQHKAGVF